MDKMMAEEMRSQLEEIRELLTSPQWIHWTNFLRKERKPYFQNQVNKFIKEGNLVQAQIAMALMDDCNKQIEIFGKNVSVAEGKLKQVEGAK